MRCFPKTSAIFSVAAVIVLGYAIAAPARAVVMTYHGGGYVPHAGHYGGGYGAHGRPYVGGHGPHVITFDQQAYPAANPYEPGEPAPAPIFARPKPVDVSCLVGRPVSNSHDDFAGYRLYDACEGNWAR